MTPSQNIIAWGNVAPWAEQRQIEQDLIISRAVIELFSNELLKEQLRFRGGTALNKLHFPKPLRYSEDIDLVRTTHGEIKPILRSIREVLEPWLGEADFGRSRVAPKLIFKVDAEDGGAALRLKVEINTRETQAYDQLKSFPHSVENPWFGGSADLPSFSNEEMLATKLRALLQRDKGRDLFDLSHALAVIEDLDESRVVEMLAKLANPGFLADIRPLLSAEEAEKLTDESITEAFATVFSRLVSKIPGDAWAKTPEVAERFEIDLSS